MSTSVLRIAPIVAWLHVPSGFRGALGAAELTYRDPKACPHNTCNPGLSLLPIAHRLAACYYAMQREESRRVAPYAYVLRVRPDHLFLTPFAHPAALLASKPDGHILLWDDQVAVSRRAVASTMLLTPQLVYSTCHGAADFARACAPLDPNWHPKQCHDDHIVPCEVMFLIAAMGSTRSSVSSLHDRLLMRSWEGVPPGQLYRLSGDFCIKRELFLMDDPQNDCRNNSGCMDC